MRRFLIASLTLLALLASVAALSACGGGDDAEEILRETFSGDKDVRSGRLAVELDFASAGGGQNGQRAQPFTLRLTGPFQSAGENQMPRFDLDATVAGAGQGRSVGAVSTGAQGFITVGEDAYTVPPDIFNRFKQGFTQARREGRDRESTTLGALGVDPLKWLDDPQVEDEETIGGVETEHVSAKVDIPKFLDDLDTVLQRARRQGGQQAQQLPAQGLTPEQRRQFTETIKEARFDVWSGKDDKIMRRIAIGLQLEAPQGGSGTAANIGSGELDFSITLTNLNQAQTIAAPANPQSFAKLQKQLEQLLPALAGGGGGGGATPGGGTAPGGGAAPGGTTTPGGGGGGATQAYTECIQRAGGDIAKAQKCADLLSP